MSPKELALMVEGESEEISVPGLVTKLLDRLGGRDVLYVGKVMRVGELHGLVKGGSEDEFLRFVRRAALLRNLGAVLLLLDGDAKAKHPIHTSAGKKEFCAKEIGPFLASRAKNETPAGTKFSFAVVFARQEFESWLLAGCPELADQLQSPIDDLEKAPRDAKGKIGELTNAAYKETTHQPHYTHQLDIDRILGRNPKMRSFHRLENALRQLTAAVRSGNPVSTPC
ncbi:MAG: DUF4276 family protein [Lentisphaeria bacterium]|jgi:hypothetical protein